MWLFFNCFTILSKVLIIESNENEDMTRTQSRHRIAANFDCKRFIFYSKAMRFGPNSNCETQQKS